MPMTEKKKIVQTFWECYRKVTGARMGSVICLTKRQANDLFNKVISHPDIQVPNEHHFVKDGVTVWVQDTLIIDDLRKRFMEKVAIVPSEDSWEDVDEATRNVFKPVPKVEPSKPKLEPETPSLTVAEAFAKITTSNTAIQGIKRADTSTLSWRIARATEKV